LSTGTILALLFLILTIVLLLVLAVQR
jgi:hypothetical protein